MTNRRSGIVMPLCALALLLYAGSALAGLTITPITWNVIGLDSNSPATGPFRFPVAARVCAVGAPSNGAITATMQFHTGGTDDGTICTGPAFCINFRAGSLSSIPLTTGPLAAGSCADAYFEVAVARESAAFTRARRYSITATDGDGSVNTPRPRELYVERLISQNRNSVQNVSYSAPLTLASPFPTPPVSLTSTAAGGSFGLAVGGIYDVRLDASTATQGYEQLETFANFSNAVFRILRVQSTYTANTSPFYGVPPGTGPAITDVLYANGCNWQLSPILPNYLGCQGSGKTGGTISATYRIQVLTVPGGTSSTLNTLIYDYSGSSFHYNADNGSGGRTIYIEDPNSATISKSFGPTTIAAGGVSSLTFTITNPNRFTTVTNASFTDTLPTVPGQMSVASPAGVTYSGCGPGVFSPNPPLAGATSLSFSGATIAPLSSCVIRINVTATAQGTYNNTSSFLSINGVPTTSQATASLTVGPVTPPALCVPNAQRVEIARWSFTGLTTPIVHPIPTVSTPPAGVSVSTNFTARTTGTPAGSERSQATGEPSPSWAGVGWPAPGGLTANELPSAASTSAFGFNISTTAYRDLAISMSGLALVTGDWANPGNNFGRFYHRFNGAGTFVSSGALIDFPKGNANNPGAFGSGAWSTTGGGNVEFRFAVSGANKAEATFLMDNVVVTGCNQFLSQPTLTKAFGSSAIVAGTNTTLTFTITNPNTTTALTGVTFTDPLPAGVVVSTPLVTPTFSAGCAVGSAFTGIAAGATNLTFNGGVTASGICTATVTVRGVTPGTKNNVTSAIFSTQTQTNNGPTGFGQAQLVVFGDVLNKVFSPNPIPVGGVSTLTFVVTNPSATNPITSVGFVDTFPAGLAVAGTPNLTSSSVGCGSVGPGNNWRVTGAAQVTLSGATVPAGGSCTYTVNVTSATAATYNNVSGPISFQVNGVGPTYTGDNATASLVVNPSTPRIALQKRVALSATGPWGEFVATSPGAAIYYQFTVENIGDVVLNRPVSGFWITDNLIGGPFCNTPASLAVAAPGNENHILECVVMTTASAGPPGTFTNTATATGTPPTGPNVTAMNTASYTTSLPNLEVVKTRISGGPVPLDVSAPAGVDFEYQIDIRNKFGASVNSTLAPIVVEDTLRPGISFRSPAWSSPSVNWSCTQDLMNPAHIVCTYSAPVGSSLTLDVAAPPLILNVHAEQGVGDVNNTAVALGGGDPECNDSNPTPDTECKGPYIESTVPVVLSDISVQSGNGELIVTFGTAAEAGTLGFRVYAASTSDSANKTPLQPALTVAKGASFDAQRYEVRGPAASNRYVWIEEQTIDGGRSLYGPYPVGMIVGERDLAPSIDWNAIRAEQSSFRRLQAEAVTSVVSGNGLEAELRVGRSGWITVSYEDLSASGVVYAGQPINRLRLSRGGVAVPLSWSGSDGGVFGPGMSFSFLAKAIEGSLYTDKSVYRLNVADGPVAPLQSIYAGRGGLQEVESVSALFVHAPNRTYNFSSAVDDPWAARRVVRNNTPLASAVENFELPQKAEVGFGAESIEVVLWGGTDDVSALDHSVRLKLNGQVLNEFRFDGLNAYTYNGRLPAGLLKSGSNSLTLELVGNTEAEVDVVYLESIKVSYARALIAVNDRIDFVPQASGSSAAVGGSIFMDGFDQPGVAACSAGPNCAAYRVSGLSRADLRVLRERGREVRELGAVEVEGVPGNYSFSFALHGQLGDRVWLAPPEGAPAAVAPALPVRDLIGTARADMLIISHPSFIDGLGALVDARQAEGLSVKVVDVEDVYRNYSDGVIDPAAIRTFIAAASEQLGTRYVLLVGGDTYDYYNYGNANSISFIPTIYRVTGPYIRFGPADGVYADLNDDGYQDVALGRWPVRTSSELATVVAKTLAYPTANHDGTALLVSDRTRAGVDFADHLGQLVFALGTSWTGSSMRLDDYPVGSAASARADLAAHVNSGKALVSFLGHSSPTSWTQESLLNANHVYAGLFQNSTKPTAIWQLGCYGAYFVSPSQNTLAHALMLRPGGAALVVGASGLTNVASDLTWLSTLGTRINGQRLGDALLQSQQLMKQMGAQYDDITVGGILLGDPTLRINE
jgi:hypothetical protein